MTKSSLHASSRQPSVPEFFSHDVSEARRFFLDLHPPPDEALAVVCGGVEHSTPEYAIHRATFPFYSIEYVARGQGEVTMQGHVCALRPGRLFSYGPGVPHHIIGTPSAPLVKYFVDFTGTSALALMRACGLPPGKVSQVYPSNAVQPLFEEIIQSGLRVHRETARLCAKLLECLALKISVARAPLEGTQTLAFTTYQQCRVYLEQHFRRLRTIEQVSAECHVTGAHLCRLFRRYDHQSPYQYLLRLKVNCAAQRLQEGGVLVKQAAAEVGFPDAFHFSRVFKAVLGLSPDAFRRLR
jgi:AraC-like DNA-binding protein/quercetin dioxygenase-like cupin family protein